MRELAKRVLCLSLLSLWAISSLNSQVLSYPGTPTLLVTTTEKEPLKPGDPVPYSDDEFPLWARDLRRATVIFFGSLPLTIILGGLIYNLAKPGGFAAASTEKDYWNILIIGSSTSLAVMALDQILIHSKRKKEREKSEKEILKEEGNSLSGELPLSSSGLFLRGIQEF